ncbi:MAG: indolepyruvate oxidoreductase subunit beta [Candidatus Eremiobacterota bacterium]
MSEVTSICITGVGGQGIILASNIISKLALSAGYDVKKSEVHGMSQRGGSVISEVRYGKKVYSPLIPEGGADIVMSFEAVEALRYINKLKKDGLIIVSTQEILSSTILAGLEEYPKGILDNLKSTLHKVIPVNAMEDAKSIGTIKTVNSIMLGVLSNYLSFEQTLWEEVLKSSVPAKTVDLNLKAFMKGRAYK